MSIDALMLATRDAIRSAGLGWSKTDCDVQADGHPPPKNAGWYLAIHQDGEEPATDNLNALDEHYSFVLTLTKTVDGVPRDRLGDQLLCSRLANVGGKQSFNARAQQLKAFLHMNWWVIGLANNYLQELFAADDIVYGFCVPMHWAGTELPKLVGGEWLSADPESADTAITAEIRFRDARRLQAIATYS